MYLLRASVEYPVRCVPRIKQLFYTTYTWYHHQQPFFNLFFEKPQTFWHIRITPLLLEHVIFFIIRSRLQVLNAVQRQCWFVLNKASKSNSLTQRKHQCQRIAYLWVLWNFQCCSETAKNPWQISKDPCTVKYTRVFANHSTETTEFVEYHCSFSRNCSYSNLFAEYLKMKLSLYSVNIVIWNTNIGTLVHSL